MQDVTERQEGRHSKAMQSIWPDLKERKIKLRV